MTSFSCDIAVIGAGLAGLAAADHLKSRGYNVMVLEAENRVGGRVYTQHLPNDTHLELGAYSFGDGEQLLMDYIHRFALPIVKQSQIDKVFWFKEWAGKTTDKGSFLKGSEQEIPLSKLLTSYRPQLEKITEDLSLFDALQSVGASIEAIEWLQANTLPGLLGYGFNTNSTHAVLAFLKQYDDSTSFYAIEGGNDQLPKALAEQLKENILLNHRVQKIEQLKEQCILKGKSFTIEAKRVICAIPLFDMSKIAITPPLASQHEAIQNIPYTLCARISIVAPPITEPRGGFFLFSDRLGWFREETLFQMDPNKKTVLSVNAAGKLAEKVSASIEKWKKSIDEALLKLYLNWDPKQAEYHSHVWNQAYSYFPKDMDPLQDLARKPEGRIHFAGEHTSSEYSSMNGAIESGIRVANEIINCDTHY